MASLQKKGAGWYYQVLHRGRRHTFEPGEVSKAEADAKAAKNDEGSEFNGRFGRRAKALVSDFRAGRGVGRGPT